MVGREINIAANG